MLRVGLSSGQERIRVHIPGKRVEGIIMIKVIIELKAKKGEDISRLLRELRATAIYEPGYVTGETLVNAEDNSSIVVVHLAES